MPNIARFTNINMTVWIDQGVRPTKAQDDIFEVALFSGVIIQNSALVDKGLTAEVPLEFPLEVFVAAAIWMSEVLQMLMNHRARIFGGMYKTTVWFNGSYQQYRRPAGPIMPERLLNFLFRRMKTKKTGFQQDSRRMMVLLIPWRSTGNC
ncbi:hypothetical protein C8J57DRAFT_1212749 [Mycena rebaudengoi]|nr:hypothetical protein C8J57DRAFT_1212749 [Mycena rebaudengoi]